MNPAYGWRCVGSLLWRVLFTLFQEAVGYATAVIAGDTIYLSGVVAGPAEGEIDLAPGYERAFVTILDSNLTTLIVAVILFAIGTGPVKGFAITLAIGIITSMFTAIMFTRGMVNLIFGGRNFKKLWI